MPDARKRIGRPTAERRDMRGVRVEESLWTAAKEAAAERGESVSDVLRAALKRYVDAQARLRSR